MSGVNITILEGGKAENFGQVTKLRTDNGDGHDLWVPKVDVQTKSLSVKKNGLYYTKEYTPTASEKKDGHAYDIYGWDTITVSVKKKVKGKKKKTDPSTGLDYDVPATVEVDDDGNLVEKELPTSIEIVKEPTTTIYASGQHISISGIKVKAYLEDKSEWGEVPFNELSYSPTVASASSDESIEGYTPKDGWGNLEIPSECIPWYCTKVQAQVFHYYKEGTGVYHTDRINWTLTLNGASYFGRFNNGEHPYLFIVSDSPIGYWKEATYGPSEMGYSKTFNGKTYYAIWLNRFDLDEFTQIFDSFPMNYNMGHGLSNEANAYDLMRILYGNDEHVVGKDTVTVTWENEDLDEPLTDTYEITVVPVPN